MLTAPDQTATWIPSVCGFSRQSHGMIMFLGPVLPTTTEVAGSEACSVGQLAQ